MANCEIEIKYERRRAIYTPAFDRPALGLKKGVPVNCLVWGCYQAGDSDGMDIYFVVELGSGRCAHALIDQVQFIKDDEATMEDNNAKNSD